MRSSVYVCVPCRHVAKSSTGARTCPTCRAAMTFAGRNWRPPRLADSAAWNLIERGSWLTERVRQAGNSTMPKARRKPDPRPGTDRSRLLERQPWRPTVVGRRTQLAVEDILAADPDGPESRELAVHPSRDVRIRVARCAPLGPELLQLLLHDADQTVAAVAVRHPQLPAGFAARRRLLGAPVMVRQALAARPDLDERTVRRLLRDPDPGVVALAAAHPAAADRDLLAVPVAAIPEVRLRTMCTGLELATVLELRHDTSMTLRDARTFAALILA